MPLNLNLKKCAFRLVVVSSSIALLTFSSISLAKQQDLSELAQHNLKSSQTIPGESNAYIALLGLETATGKDMLQTGNEILNTYQKAYDSNTLKSLANDWITAILENQGLDENWLKQAPHCNARTGSNCPEQMKTSGEVVSVNPQRLETLIVRYLQILSYSNFQESQFVANGMPWPNYGFFGKLSTLHKGNLYNSGDIAGLVELIDKENTFWRMLLDSGESLIVKMVATSNLWKNVQLIATLHKNDELAEKYYQTAINWAAPLSADSLDIGESFAYELKYTAGAIKQLNGSGELLLQPTVSLNALQQHFVTPLQCLSKLPTDSFKTFYQYRNTKPLPEICNIAEAVAITENPSSILFQLAEQNINLANSLISVTDYIARVHDLNEMLSLLNHQLTNKQNTGVSGFDCLSPGSVCQLSSR